MFIGLHHQKWALWENPPNISSWMATGNRGARHHFNPHKQITDRPHLKSRPVGVIDMGGEREGGRGVSVLCGWMQWIGSRSTTRAGGRAMGRTWPASDKTKRRAAYSMLLAASPAPPPQPPCFQPHGIRVRGCSSHVGLDHDIDLGGSPSSTPVVFGAFHQTGGDL